MLSLWNSPRTPACAFSSAPQGGSTCKPNTEGADPLTVSWTGATEKSSPGEAWSGPTEDRSNPDSDHPEGGSQRDRSLDSDRDHPPEELEFGGFVQAPAAWSPECTNHSWSHSDGGGACGSWGQSDGSWAAFPADEAEQTEECGGQWWSLSSTEDRGLTPGASRSSGALFAVAFPSPLDPSPDEPADGAVPTLTQLLRGGVDLQEDGCVEQRLLDPFHDLNRMIDRRVSGVSRERLQWSLGLTPPALGSGARPAHRRLSLGHASCKPRPLSSPVPF